MVLSYASERSKDYYIHQELPEFCLVFLADVTRVSICIDASCVHLVEQYYETLKFSTSKVHLSIVCPLLLGPIKARPNFLGLQDLGRISAPSSHLKLLISS